MSLPSLPNTITLLILPYWIPSSWFSDIEEVVSTSTLNFLSSAKFHVVVFRVFRKTKNTVDVTFLNYENLHSSFCLHMACLVHLISLNRQVSLKLTITIINLHVQWYEKLVKPSKGVGMVIVSWHSVASKDPIEKVQQEPLEGLWQGEYHWKWNILSSLTTELWGRLLLHKKDGLHGDFLNLLCKMAFRASPALIVGGNYGTWFWCLSVIRFYRYNHITIHSSFLRKFWWRFLPWSS